MKSLAERHIERAQRKADNAAESSMPQTSGLQNALNLAGQLGDAMGGLSDEDKSKVADVLKNSTADSISLAEDTAGNFSLSSIGTINPDVVPLSVAMERSGTPALTGELPQPSFDPANGNLNGQAVEAAGTPANAGGWGTPSVSDPDGYSALSNNELKAKLDERQVTYTSSLNKDGLIDLLRNSDKAQAGNGGGGNS